MNENHREDRGTGPDDLIEQIITQGLEKLNEPPPEAGPAGPEQQKDEEAASPADRQSKRTAVYLYLLIMFGAAFLMLLLAYFAQQRNSEDTISGLRDSMNFSQEELLAKIKELEDKISTLEKENAELERQNEVLSGGFGSIYQDLIQLKKDYNIQVQETDSLNLQYRAAQAELYAWRTVWKLEEFYRAKDYESCAAVILAHGRGQFEYRTPDDALLRYEEIVHALIDAGILKEDYMEHLDDYEYLIDAYFERFGGWPLY